ncbi:MAG: hypothetical protein CL693_17430 [Cellvibrionaceae bacterium]|nr:hypothetical protein [Cellvibrionaceae bacterium]
MAHLLKAGQPAELDRRNVKIFPRYRLTVYNVKPRCSKIFIPCMKHSLKNKKEDKDALFFCFG